MLTLFPNCVLRTAVDSELHLLQAKFSKAEGHEIKKLLSEMQPCFPPVIILEFFGELNVVPLPKNVIFFPLNI